MAERKKRKSAIAKIQEDLEGILKSNAELVELVSAVNENLSNIFMALVGIKDGIREVTDIIRKHTPEGEIEKFDIELRESKRSEKLVPRVSPWYSVLFINEGPGDVLVSTSMSPLIKLTSSQKYFKVSYRTKAISGIHIELDNGSSESTVTVVCLR